MTAPSRASDADRSQAAQIARDLSGLSISGLLLDLDGTLADTEVLHLQAHRQALAAAGIELSDHDIEANRGGSDRALYRRLVRTQRDPETDPEHSSDHQSAELEAMVEQWLNAKDAAYHEQLDAGAVTAMPGAVELVQYAHECGLRMALVTNSPRAVAERVLEAIGLAPLLNKRVCWEDTTDHKPLPAPYLRGLAQIQRDAQQVLVCEDSLPGVRAASAAGIRCIGVASDCIGSPALIAAGAMAAVDNLLVVKQALQLRQRP